MTRLFPTTKNVGVNTEYHPNGNIKLEDTYVYANGKEYPVVLDGLWTEWYENGQKKQREITKKVHKTVCGFFGMRMVVLMR
jgi:antitoxin component YwqK of YwqJK toxin-antitoxin module